MPHGDAIAQDTIAAVITASGMGAMGALRLSGPDAYAAAGRVFRSKKGQPIDGFDGYSLHFGGVYLDGAFLDQALLLKMKSPHSFTGEDVAEIQCHGGPMVINRLLAALTGFPDLPIRPADPGEFSLRAFLHGKIDMSQAEAVMELVSAGNPTAAQIAAGQLEGGLSRWIRRLAEGILLLLAEIEVEVDFPDEELGGPGSPSTRAKQAALLLAEAEEIWASAERGRIYREGIRVVFYGRPNAGKSSLLNGILDEPRAIVTPEPGTTRDVLEAHVLLKGIPLVLTDTAGIRASGSQAEQAGVARARDAAAKADLILYVVDSQEGVTAEDVGLLAELDRDKTMIVLNKTDLAAVPTDADEGWGIPAQYAQWAHCRLCALAPEGLDVLASHIRAFFDGGRMGPPKPETILNQRQSEALLRARRALADAAQALAAGVPEDIAAIDLRGAWTCLGELTGETLQPELVEKIFSTFCLGK